LRTVSVSAAGRRLVAGVETVGPVNREVGYHLVAHVLGAAGELQVFQFEWTGTRVSGMSVRNGVLRAVTGPQVSTTNGGRVSELRMPLPWSGAPPVLLVRVWTTKGNRVLDQTGVALITPAPPASPH